MIKEGTLALKFSYADYKQIARKALSVGFTVEELLIKYAEDFMNETCEADEWLENYREKTFPSMPLLHYITNYITENDFWGDFDAVDFLQCFDDIEMYRKEITENEEVLADATYPWQEECGGRYATREEWASDINESIQSAQEEILNREERITSIWDGFVEWMGEDAEGLSLEKEVGKIREKMEQSDKAFARFKAQRKQIHSEIAPKL